MQPENMRERGADDIHRSEVNRAHEHADEQRRREEHERSGHPEGRPPGMRQRRRRNAFPTPRTKSTTRGPQRDATESSTAMTDPVRTAAMPLQPGRFATVAGD